MAVMEFEYGGKQQYIGRCGGRGVRRAAFVVRKAGGGDRKRASGLSGSVYGRNYGALCPDIGLVRHVVLRISGTYRQPEATVNNGGFQRVFSHNGILFNNGYEAQWLGASHANTPMVSHHKTAERTGGAGAHGSQLPVSHRDQPAAYYGMRPVAQSFMGQFCSYATSGDTYSPADRPLNSNYLGRGACFVSRSGAGTWSGKGWGVLSSDIGFLIESVARPMMG